MNLLDFLIVTIPHRHALLCELLEAIDQQSREGVGAIVYRDNLEVSYGEKTRRVLYASGAEYVVCVDDDDMIAPNYVERVCEALESRPDYVGYPVLWTVDGQPQLPVEHSLRHAGWGNTAEMLKRDIVHKNPIKREIALLGDWAGGYGADATWAHQVRERAQIEAMTEVWIPETMYYYRQLNSDFFLTPRAPLAAGLIEPLPTYPWLVEYTP